MCSSHASSFRILLTFAIDVFTESFIGVGEGLAKYGAPLLFEVPYVRKNHVPRI